MDKLDTQSGDQLDDISDILFTVPKPTVDRCFKSTHPSETWGLYSFYYMTAKSQKTNRVWATDSFVKKGLNWGKDRLLRTKKELVSMGLIEPIKTRGKGGKMGKTYIQVKYILTAKKREELTSDQCAENRLVGDASPVHCFHTSGKTETNALRNEFKCLKKRIKKTNKKKVCDKNDFSSDQFSLSLNDHQDISEHSKKETCTKGSKSEELILASPEELKLKQQLTLLEEIDCTASESSKMERLIEYRVIVLDKTFNSVSELVDMMSDAKEIDQKNTSPASSVKSTPKPKTDDKGYTNDFNEFMATYPQRHVKSPVKTAWSRWKACLKQGATAKELITACSNYFDYCTTSGKLGTQYTAQASTFLNADGYWKSYSEKVCTPPNGELFAKPMEADGEIDYDLPENWNKAPWHDTLDLEYLQDLHNRAPKF